jgi:AcrR family transcriptional regulator
MTRVESAAATRRALLDDAAKLLDHGGTAAVTLREVGARSGVSRGAPYRHFADKNDLLAAVAAEGWQRLGEQFHELRQDQRRTAIDKLRAALAGILTLSREQPYLYQLMFTPPAGDPAAVVRAAERLCDEFVTLVADAVGDQDAQPCAAVLLTGAHGAAGLQQSGLLGTEKWQSTADELVDTLLALVIKA